MREIVFSKGEVKPGKALPGKDLVLKNCGDRGCIVFVIRRPGCSYCREQALYLKYLATHEEELLRGFKLCGVVKELCADSEGLIDFHTNFFPFPIYHDDDLLFYKALGDRKVGIIEAFNLNNPFGRNKKRVSKLPGNFAGEGFLRGGVLLFDHKGEPAYMFEEQTGNELPVGDIVTAARTIRKTYAKSFVLENIRNSQ